MPGRSGADLLVELKRNVPQLPVLVLTAENRRSSRDRAEELGADVLTKRSARSS